MLNITVLYQLILVFMLILSIKCATVQFDAPKLMLKNVPYKLIIHNSSPGEKFPVDNFVLSFELLSKLNPRIEFSIADVSSDTFTGDEYRGFSIKNFVMKKETMEMNIEFRRDAYGTIFRIRYSAAKTDNEKEDFFNTDTNRGIILERFVDMLLPYLIVMQGGPDIRDLSLADKETIGQVFVPNKNGQISCIASEGLPDANPKFVNNNELLGSNVNPVNKDAAKLVWMVRLEDHGKEIQCMAGNDKMNFTINVFHYMTDVVSSPIVYNKVERGSQIKCVAKNGYPTPKTAWHFISGPPEPNKYYQLRDNNVSLLINETAILNTNWTFECRGSNFIPTVVRQYLSASSPNYPIIRTYNFTIVDPSNTDVQSSSIGIIMLIIILTILFLSTIIICIIQKRKIQKFINDKRLRAGQTSKMPQKSIDSGYKYSGVGTDDSLVNGADKEEAICYSEIVATVQSKTLGPIHRV